MMRNTHVAVGILLLFAVDRFTPWLAGQEITGAALLLLGAVLPDIDSSTSRLGKRFSLLTAFLKHRGFFHSIFAMTALTILVYIVSADHYFAYVFLVGYFSHLVADSVSKEGTRLFYPSDLKISGPLRVGGWVESVIFLLLAGLAVFLVV